MIDHIPAGRRLLEGSAPLAAGLALLALVPGSSRAQGASGEQPKLPSAELTIHMTGLTGWTRTSPLHVRLAALGAPPAGRVRLANGAGLNEATVTFPPSKCATDRLRYTGLGTDEWCLEIRGLAPGSDSSETIATDRMMLKLTIGVRHDFWFLPFLVTLASFIVGLLAAWLTTDVVPSFVSRKLVDDELAANCAGRADRKILGLRDWVSRQREGTSDKTLLPLVRALRAYAPDQAKRAREGLGEALAQSPLPARNPIRTSAEREAAETELSVDDFYSDGTKRERHPASELILTLNRANGIEHQLSRAKETIEALPPVQRTGLPDLLAHAERVFQEAADETGLGFAEEVLRDLWRKIHDRMIDGAGERDAGFLAPEREVQAEPVAMDRYAPISSLPSLVLERFQPILAAGAATLGAILLLAAIATAAVASASYVPKETFGTLADYLALFVSGFGSTAAAGILGALLLWQRTKKA